MTDAATPVTESAVERFVKAYLESLGADIRKQGREWSVSLPADAESELDLDGATFVVTTDPDAVDEDVIALSPDNEFVERLFDEAADRHPVGSLALTGDSVKIRRPGWLETTPVEVVEQSFTPYYDRRALCALFHAGIETVSEYQSEKLRAVAVDLNDHDSRPGLAETYLDLAASADDEVGVGPTPDLDTMRDALAAARETAEANIQPAIEDIRKQATRAAHVELEEYREYAIQRVDELASDLERMNERIEEATAQIEGAEEQGERVEALRHRKELRAERDQLRGERDELRAEIEAGFPDHRREVRDRHALSVRIRPVAVAAVSYERGDLKVTLREGDATVDATYPYAAGIGVTDEQHCVRCGELLSEQNPLTITNNQLECMKCSP